MAHQAFALSPITARASLPSEEDYEAIREAFQETARGRWFLDEYAKRNRNADTRMVLDAVARIEQTIAAQKQPPPPVVVDRLPAALMSIRSAVAKAEGAATTAFDGQRIEENLAPIRKGSRIIKEISWRWREIGADGRICDLIDSQVAAIDTACTQLAETDPRVAIKAAFEIIRAEIEAFRSGDEAAAAVAEMPRPVAPKAEAPARSPVAAAPAAVSEELPPSEVETAFNEPDLPGEAATSQETISQEEADAEDEAVLEAVAMEMAAPDPDDGAGDFSEPVAEGAEDGPMHVTTPPVVEPLTPVARAPELEVGPPPVAAQAPALQPSLHLVSSAAPDVESEPSLGSTLIASGILRKPGIPANDPLAPIRRMSQAEKIAFFS
jgi:hypothetical protein